MKTKRYLPLLLLLPLFTACGPGPDDPQPTRYSYWRIKGQDFTSTHTTTNNQVVETDCDDNHKIWATFGQIPTAEKTLKVVPYGKTPLAADEVILDVAHGSGLDYLTTGTGGVTVDVGYVQQTGFTPDVLYLVLNDVPVQGTGSTGPIKGDTTTVSGYIQLQ